MSHSDLLLFLTQIAVMLAAALVFGNLARRWGQPAVFGELLGGVLIGATVLGTLMPEAYATLFPATGLTVVARQAVIKLGMLFFLFVAGMEVDLSLLRGSPARAAAISILGMAVPWALGFGLVWTLPALLGAATESDRWALGLFLGTALSISALPVITRTLMDLGLLKTELGILVVAAAMFDDLAGWLLFASLTPRMKTAPEAGTHFWVSCGLVLVLFVLFVTVGRAAGRRALPWLRSNFPWPSGFLGATAILVLGAGALFEALGVHAALGAFLVGVAMAPSSTQKDSDMETVTQFVTGFFGAPVFFVSLGLGVSFIRNFEPLLVTLVLVTACAGKIGGALAGTTLCRMPLREGLAIGFGMNARGAMEMILASVALEAGMIDERLYVALIVMALVTSMLGGPMMKRLAPPRPA